MRSKLFSLAIVLLLLLATFGTALAQDMPKPICGQLSEADCGILAKAQEAMSQVASYKAKGTYSANLAGIPGAPAKDVGVNVTVDGAFNWGPDAVAAIAALAPAASDSAAAQKAIAANPEILSNLLGGAQIDANLSVETSPEVAAALGAEAGVQLPAKLSVPVKLVDGVFYFDQTEIAPLVQGATAGWIGVPVKELVDMAIQNGTLQASLNEANAQAMAQANPAAAGLLAAQMALMNPATLEQFMTVSRGKDAAVGDVKAAAVFDTKIDLGKFVTSPEFMSLLKEAAASGAIQGVSAADIDQAAQMLPLLAPVLFQGLDMGSSETVDPESGHVLQYGSNFTWDMSNLSQVAAMSGQQIPGLTPGEKLAVDIKTNVENSDIGMEQMVEAPADAAMIPAEALMAQPAQ